MWILLVLQNDRVAVDCFLMEVVGVVHVGQVVEDVEGKVDVDLIKAACLLAQLPDLLFFRCCLFTLLKCLIQVLLDLSRRRLLE